ncbi:Uncharacterized protein dnm_067440 [Desulfonema magnum]|uniref:Uncharacterized protein n=1 Tax=Desulfonema magnum TaxID=45655 RepID=A0A975BSA5_9BACT|nr:Uncharacterized protein dnm_067440 [Desulfonema magnum]
MLSSKKKSVNSVVIRVNLRFGSAVTRFYNFRYVNRKM